MPANESNLSQEDKQGIENAMLKKGIIPDWMLNIDKKDLENFHKNVIKEAKDDFDRFKNAINSYSKQYPSLEPITRKIRIITKPTENILKIADYSLEYVINGGREVIIKAIAEGVESVVYVTGINVSVVAAGLVTLIGGLCDEPFAAVIAFVTFTKGETLSYYISQKAKEFIIDFFNPKIQYFPQTLDFGNGQYFNNNKSIEEIFLELKNTLGLMNLSPHPSLSKEYEQTPIKKQELVSKTNIASAYNIKSDINQSFIDKEFLKNIQDIEEQEQIIEREKVKYNYSLKLYKEEKRIKNEILSLAFKSLNQTLAFQLKEKDKILNSNESLSLISNHKYLIKVLNLEDINSIHLTSSFAYLRALFLCENIIVIDEKDNEVLNENKAKETLNYNDDEYILFLLHKNTLSQEYLEARKSLYKTLYDFKELQIKDLEYAYQTYRNSLMNKEINKDKKSNNENWANNQTHSFHLKQEHKNNTTSNKDKNLENNLKGIEGKLDFNLLSYHNKALNHFILENKDKSQRIIFLANASSLSNLIHIYNHQCDIFTKDESLIDIALLEKEYEIDFTKLNARIFFYEKLLLGAKENDTFSFEDKKEKVYYYCKYNKEDLTAYQDLNVTYNLYNLKIKNYSLKQKSLNIKLEPKELREEFNMLKENYVFI